MSAVKSVRPDIKVVFMSGYPDSPRMVEALSDPDVIFLEKPFGAATLAVTLRKVLDRE